MYFFLPVDLHDGIGRQAPLLSRIREAAGIHGNNVIIDIDHRAVGMSIQHDIHTAVNGFFLIVSLPMDT